MNDIIETFSALVALDSPSFGERQVADFIRNRLEALGIPVSEDDAGRKIGGNSGNLFACVPGDRAQPALLFCTHMDTVEPSRGKRAVVQADGVIRSAGDTVLGADDFAGAAAVLTAVERVMKQRNPHPPLELLFTAAEEPYCTGVRHFDFSVCHAKTGYVLDLTGEIGTAAVAAPTILSFELEITGRAAHAGFAPQEGIHAIQAAAKAMAILKQGHIDSETTLNFGVISGGTARNIVPETCLVAGEIRSAVHKRALKLFKAITAAFQKEADAAGAALRVTHDIPITAYRAKADGEAVKRFVRACAAEGIQPVLTKTFGGSDNAAMQANGIDGIVLASAMHSCHSTAEYTTVSELRRLEALVYRLIMEKAEFGRKGASD